MRLGPILIALVVATIVATASGVVAAAPDTSTPHVTPAATPRQQPTLKHTTAPPKPPVGTFSPFGKRFTFARRVRQDEASQWGGRVIGFFGVFVLMGIAFLFSRKVHLINWRIVGWGLALQFGLAIFILKVPWGIWIFEKMTVVVNATLEFTLEGSRFIFGKLVDPRSSGFIFAFQILPTIIFISSLFAVLFYLGIVQRVVKVFAVVMSKLMGISGAESFATAANIFVGQTEAPLVVGPYIQRMTRSELMLLMVGGFATVAGGIMAVYIMFGIDAGHVLTASIMSAPAAVVCAKLMVPETEVPETADQLHIEVEIPDTNVLDAATRGASDGVRLAVNVGAMLLAVIALVYMLNVLLAKIGAWVGYPALSLQWILGWAFWGLTWILGVPTSDCTQLAQLFGTKIVLNELLAYKDLGPVYGDCQYLDQLVSHSSFLLSQPDIALGALKRIVATDNLLQHNLYLQELARDPALIQQAFLVKSLSLPVGGDALRNAVENSPLLKAVLTPIVHDAKLSLGVLQQFLTDPRYYLNMDQFQTARAFGDPWNPTYLAAVKQHLTTPEGQRLLTEAIKVNLPVLHRFDVVREILQQATAGGQASAAFAKQLITRITLDPTHFGNAIHNMLQHPDVHIHPRSFVIATYALCGFANFSSIAIQIGGIGAIAPNRKQDLARLGLMAMIGGALAAFMTAAIAGVII